jgi:hypothetical protein
VGSVAQHEVHSGLLEGLPNKLRYTSQGLIKMKKPFLVTAVLLGAMTAANARGIHEMQFQKGKECWSYQGNDSSFVGHFLSWQDITVQSVLRD